MVTETEQHEQQLALLARQIERLQLARGPPSRVAGSVTDGCQGDSEGESESDHEGETTDQTATATAVVPAPRHEGAMVLFSAGEVSSFFLVSVLVTVVPGCIALLMLREIRVWAFCLTELVCRLSAHPTYIPRGEHAGWAAAGPAGSCERAMGCVNDARRAFCRCRV